MDRHPVRSRRTRASATAGAGSAGARIWAGLAVVFWAVGFYGIIDLLMPFGADEDHVAVVGLDASWGVLFTFIVSGAFLQMALLPRDPWPAAVQLGIAAAALLLAATFTHSMDSVGVAALLIPMTLVFFALLGEQVPRVRARRTRPWLEVDGPLFVLALLGAPPWWGYAAAAVSGSLAPGGPRDETWGLSHWPVQAALGFFLAVAVLVMAFCPPCRPLFGITCGLGSLMLGLSWLLYPHSAGSVDDATLSVLTMLWGAAVLAGSFISRRHPDPGRPAGVRAGVPDWPAPSAAAPSAPAS